MTINLEIIDSAFVYASEEIEDLNTKVLVPEMMARRRLTRAAKIAIYLADKVSFVNGRIIYGSSFGELGVTAGILNSISSNESISPTHFQNSVYNTAVSYLSMLAGNTHEIMTVSCGNDTSLNILKSGAIKSLDGDTLLLLATETLNIDKIEEVNQCIDFLECGVALKVRMTKEEATLSFDVKNKVIKTPQSLSHMIAIARNIQTSQPNIIKVTL